MPSDLEKGRAGPKAGRFKFFILFIAISGFVKSLLDACSVIDAILCERELSLEFGVDHSFGGQDHRMFTEVL